MIENDERRLRRIEVKTDALLGLATAAVFVWIIDTFGTSLVSRYGWSHGFADTAAFVLGLAAVAWIRYAVDKDSN